MTMKNHDVIIDLMISYLDFIAYVLMIYQKTVTNLLKMINVYGCVMVKYTTSNILYKNMIQNAKVIVKEAIEPGVYDVACWMGETEKGKYMKVTFDPQTHLTQEDKKSEQSDDAPF